MDKKKNYQALKKFAQRQAVDLFGVADIRKIRDAFLLCVPLQEKLDKAVVLGVSLSQGILDEVTNAPTRLYFHHYKTVNAFLDQTAFKVANYIQKKGFLALPIPASQIVDWQNQKAHLSHKQLGLLAGLGWIGRHNLLVNKELGSQFRLASILTNMPLYIGKQTRENCGPCRRCIAVCPAAAIKENPRDFDHIRCFEKLKEFQKRKLADQYICGVCVNACKPLLPRL